MVRLIKRNKVFLFCLVSIIAFAQFIQAETDIDGIYYLRDDLPTHGQPDGLIRDVGAFLRTAPVVKESKFCTSWVQFYFDEDGTYTQVNQIDNIYYHTWWVTDNSEASLGYDETGGYNINTSENFAVNDINSPNKLNGHYLYAGKQTFAIVQNIPGVAIYNFGIKLFNIAHCPHVISYPDQYSFIILNLPDNITLQSQDSDVDYLSDYEELFTYYTNPYDTDTDRDGWDDKYEVDNSLNPIDPDSPPVFKKRLIQQYDGLEVGDGLGYSFCSISDIDGDGKDDILIGALYANPGGLNDAGSAYIYSSSTGNLIRQYDGGAVNDNFGCPVCSISDVDGDGKGDVLVGATGADPGGLFGAGSVYIYSSGTGNLLQQYDGKAVLDAFGSPLSSISDIDGDGKGDVLVGMPMADPGGRNNAGSVYLYSSGTGNLIRQYDGIAANDRLGSSICSISDIDGDGKDDVLMGAPYASPGAVFSAGSAYIYSSGTGNLLRQYDGGAVLDNFGQSVSSISDIDGDGKDDVLVGTYKTDPFGLTDAGSVYIYSSNTGNLLIQYNGESYSYYFGCSICSISDVDGDGKDDVLAGAYEADPLGIKDAGSAFIYSSNTGNLLNQFNGTYRDNFFGRLVSSIGDIDGDGKGDMLIGVPDADPGGLSNAGSVYLYSSTGYIPNQSWEKGSDYSDVFDLDDYFEDPNNSTIPARNQTITYTASTIDNPYINVYIDEENIVSFSQLPGWIGTETVVFTATDSTGLYSQSNTVLLEVTGRLETSSDDDDSANCCIATAVYGSPMSSEIKNLRNFRDEYLLTNPIGEVSVSVYYEISPLLAKVITRNPILRNTAKSLFAPLVFAITDNR